MKNCFTLTLPLTLPGMGRTMATALGVKKEILVSNVIRVATMFAWTAISLSSQAQTGRIYTSDDYSRAANLLNAGTISLVDHAVKQRHLHRRRSLLVPRQ